MVLQVRVNRVSALLGHDFELEITKPFYSNCFVNLLSRRTGDIDLAPSLPKLSLSLSPTES